MSLVSGTMGAVMGSDATSEAASLAAGAQMNASATQADIAAKQLAYQKDLMQPYRSVGSEGLAKLYGNDVRYQDLSGFREDSASDVAGARLTWMLEHPTEAAAAGWVPSGNTYERVGQRQPGASTPFDEGGKYYFDSKGNLVPESATYKIAKGTGKPFDMFTDPVTGQKISYDDMVTKQLGEDAYKQSPEYVAQNALAQKALSRARQARGLEYAAPASAAAQSAELSQKLTASDYANYKADLVNRYNALRGQAATQYDFLTQQANLGLGATTALGGAGQTAAQMQAGAAQQQAAAANTLAAGGAQAGRMWSGLGGASANTLSALTKGYDYGKSQGWWGDGGAFATMPTSTASEAIDATALI